jgi:hypothetical protein
MSGPFGRKTKGKIDVEKQRERERERGRERGREISDINKSKWNNIF